ncbi:MAG: hypothetical protein F4089_03465 [Gammaproteobacteria bacterium]|nr:hypothetical protein [Gammaproteobacteria bacterium]
MLRIAARWFVASLAGLLALSAALPASAQDSTATAELRVWQRIGDPLQIYVSARHEAGSWATLGTIPLALDRENSSGTFRYGDISLEVPLASGNLTTTVELRVWQRIGDPLQIYVSARHEAGSWNTLGTIPLPLDQETKSGTFRYGDTSLEVPLLSGEPSQPPAAVAEPTASPDVTTIHVPRGDGISLVFVGSGPPACVGSSRIGDGEWTCGEWGLSHAERRTFLTAEMAKIAAFFADRFGVAPPAQVTVLLDISGSFVNQAFSGRGLSEPAAEGFSSGSIIMAFGVGADSGAIAAGILAHEYYHVLQFHLAEGSPYTGGTPGWLVEGSAEYASELYAGLPDADRRAELAVRSLDPATGTLRENTRTGDWYALGALAVDWLTEHAGGDGAHVQYWRELATGAAWQDAFEAAFGLTPDAFYNRFEVYRPEAVRASRPHLADDIAEPIVVTVGEVPREVEARVRAELARRQRAGDVADFTVYLADAASYPAIFARLHDGRQPQPNTFGACFSRKTWPPAASALALNASCSATVHADAIAVLYTDLQILTE